MTRKNVVVALGLGTYLLGFGILSGVAYERIRFDRQRAAVLAEHDRAVRA
jgi:hypothetical protein